MVHELDTAISPLQQGHTVSSEQQHKDNNEQFPITSYCSNSFSEQPNISIKCIFIFQVAPPPQDHCVSVQYVSPYFTLKLSTNVSYR